MTGWGESIQVAYCLNAESRWAGVALRRLDEYWESCVGTGNKVGTDEVASPYCEAVLGCDGKNDLDGAGGNVATVHGIRVEVYAREQSMGWTVGASLMIESIMRCWSI